MRHYRDFQPLSSAGSSGLTDDLRLTFCTKAPHFVAILCHPGHCFPFDGRLTKLAELIAPLARYLYRGDSNSLSKQLALRIVRTRLANRFVVTLTGCRESLPGEGCHKAQPNDSLNGNLSQGRFLHLTEFPPPFTRLHRLSLTQGLFESSRALPKTQGNINPAKLGNPLALSRIMRQT